MTTSPKRTSFEKMFLIFYGSIMGLTRLLQRRVYLFCGTAPRAARAGTRSQGRMCDNTSPARDKQGNIVCDRAGSTNTPQGTLWVTCKFYVPTLKLELRTFRASWMRYSLNATIPWKLSHYQGDRGSWIDCDNGSYTIIKCSDTVFLPILDCPDTWSSSSDR